MSGLLAQVRALYESYPYPHYPLLARPRWQEGYLAHSRFSARLAADLGWRVGMSLTAEDGGITAAATVLVGGSGEILPYILHRWESPRCRVVCVDLSSRSLWRARARLSMDRNLGRNLLCWGRRRFWRGDLEAYLLRSPAGSLAHIDAYGVVHHMPNPSRTLAAMGRALKPGGTLRLMVYNAPARRWIHHLQRFFADLGLDAMRRSDLAVARRLLQAASAAAPALAERLRAMGPEVLSNSARFADTFLHPREATLGIEHWFKASTAAGLVPVGLFDRYGELDDLPNPLWHPPSPAALAERAADGRLENNLELYLVAGRSWLHKEITPTPFQGASAAPGLAWSGLGSMALALAGSWAGGLPRLSPPPQRWFTYQETRGIGWAWRWRLWQAHLDWIERQKACPMEDWLRSLPLPAAMRLARLGAILPGQIQDSGWRRTLAAPMVERMDAPERPAAVDVRTLPLAAEVERVLRQAQRWSERRLRCALRRLELAQT